MNRIVLLIFFLVGTGAFSLFSPSDFLGVSRYYYVSACEKPIFYKIGWVDSRFNLTDSEVNSALEEASNIWNQTIGKKLFEYSPDAILSVYMVYDKRQFLSTRINDLDTELEVNKSSLEKEIEAYKASSEDFERRSGEFGKKVEYWNSRGGAPQEEYDKLISEEQSLQEEATRLNETAKRLNLSTNDYNTHVIELNQTLGSLKNALLVKPEEGLYDPQNNRIAIYLNNNRTELVRTMAHELGHARGLSHIANEKAIMYPSTTEHLDPVPEEISNLEEICRPRPFYEVILDTYQKNLSSFLK